MIYDCIGDVHGCYGECIELFHKLGYQFDEDNIPVHPNGNTPVFIGDITDRGPKSIEMINLVWTLTIQRKTALYIPGNHCNKLYRYFLGNKVKAVHGLETTIAELEALSKPVRKKVRDHFMQLYESAPLYLVLDQGKLVLAHAGIKKEFIGATHKGVKTFVLYGDITGKTLPDGRPERRDWALRHPGDPIIVYGHTPVREPRIKNNTYNIDTGAVFGGKLTALRYPEMTLFSVTSSQPLVPEKFHTYEH
jgi:protein phosphatase